MTGIPEQGVDQERLGVSPADMAVSRVYTTMLGFISGEEQAQTALASLWTYREGARPIMAVLLLSEENMAKRTQADELLGKALELSREQSNLTIQGLAQATGLRPSEITGLEEGRINFSHLGIILELAALREQVPEQFDQLVAKTRQATE